MALYLVDAKKRLIGICVKYPDGWLFNPQNTARSPGRVHRKSAVKCIPDWAFKMSDDLLTRSEFEKLHARPLAPAPERRGHHQQQQHAKDTRK